LITAWENPWDFSLETMKMSKYIEMNLVGGNWVDAITSLCAKNRIYPNRVWHHPLVDQKTLYGLIRNSDIGIFPNRCEGGTNLALMEYMACGKPVIASYNTGHMDVLTESNSLRLREMKPNKCTPFDG
jgi:glycosyltransferase involved in cell wall biosynthesis